MRLMNILKIGGHSLEKLALMLSVTNIRSEAVIGAIEDRLIRGADLETAAALNGVPSSNLKRALDKLNAVAHAFERAKEIDLAAARSVK